MKERRFRISCMCGWDPNTFGTFDEFADRIRAAKDMGYEAVELSLGKPLGYEPKRMMKLLLSMKMPIANFLTGGNGVKDGLYFSSRDPETRAKAVERICELIPIASEMGASMVIGTMQGKTVEPDYEVGKARVIDCLKQIASTAEKYNQLIVLEPMNFMDCAYHHTLEETMQTIRLIGCKCYKPMLDTIHMNIEESSMILPFFAAGSELKHVHLCETSCKVPGAGMLDYKAVFGALREIGYDRFVCVKVDRAPWPNGHREAMEYFRALKLL